MHPLPSRTWTWFLAGDAVSGKLFAYSGSCISAGIRKQEVLRLMLPTSGWKSPRTASVGRGQCHVDTCGSPACPITCLGTGGVNGENLTGAATHWVCPQVGRSVNPHSCPTTQGRGKAICTPRELPPGWAAGLGHGSGADMGQGGHQACQAWLTSLLMDAPCPGEPAAVRAARVSPAAQTNSSHA